MAWKDDIHHVVGAAAAERVRCWEDSFKNFHVEVDGQEFKNVKPVWAFPISHKAEYVSFLDTRGKEVALLASPHRLDKKSRAALWRTFGRIYFVPKIRKVYSIIEHFGVTFWQVQTDAGYASFEVASREHIRKLPAGRLIIVDVDENRYEVEDVNALDLRSQAIIQSEI